MPQLSQAGAIYASQLFWLAIVFALIYFGIGKAMVPRIERTIDDRGARIAGDLTAAEQARDTAKSSDDAYQTGLDSARAQASHTVGEARSRATSASEARVKEGDAATAEHVAAATGRIDQAKTGALGEIEAATVDAVQAIVAKLAGMVPERELVERQVREELAHG